MSDDIIFWNKDADGVEAPMIDPLVIIVMIGLAIVWKVLVDCGSSVNMLFKNAYGKILSEVKGLKPCKSQIYRSNGMAIELIGYVELSMLLGEGNCKRMHVGPFLAFDIYSAYNAFGPS